VTVYTDGSATGGTLDGGSAAVVTRGDPEEPVVVVSLSRKGAHFTSSFETEIQALTLAADWLKSSGETGPVCICTDSRSAVNAIGNPLFRSKGVDALRQALRRPGVLTVLQWVPSHVNVPGNELADRAAKAVAQASVDSPNNDPLDVTS
jgi:ribonuclease HI